VAATWEEIEPQLRQEWDSTVVATRRPWNEVRDDVRFGWEQAHRPELAGADWADVVGVLEGRWESFPHAHFEDWHACEDAVRLGFQRAREMGILAE